MAQLKIVRIGNPALRTKSKSVSKQELKTPLFQKFLDDLAATCIANDGAGIAAPQVGVNKRVIIVHVDPKSPRYPKRKAFPLTVVINPKVVSQSKLTNKDWEGDLSANFRGLVSRSSRCVVEGLDRDAKPVKFELKDEFHARVFQHEIDHLDGYFFIDKVADTKSITEFAEWKKYWKNKK